MRQYDPEGEFAEEFDKLQLDIEIASGSFRADLISMWMDEAKIPDELSYWKLLKQYRKFFNARERRQQFINVCEGEYTKSKWPSWAKTGQRI